MSEVEKLTTMDENEEVKRKVKRAKVEDEPSMSGFLMPDKDGKPLVMEVLLIVASSTDHVWVEIPLTMLVTTTIH